MMRNIKGAGPTPPFTPKSGVKRGGDRPENWELQQLGEWHSDRRLEAVLQTDAAIEDQMSGGGILAVKAEVAQAHELEMAGGDNSGQ